MAPDLGAVRLLVATGVLLTAGIASNSSSCVADHRVVAARGEQPDDITEDGKRFEELTLWLPPRGVVGYLQPDDWPSADAQRRFYLAQYALAPRVVIMSSRPEFVIGTPQASAGGSARVPGDTDPRLPDHALYQRSGGGLRIFRRIR